MTDARGWARTHDDVELIRADGPNVNAHETSMRRVGVGRLLRTYVQVIDTRWGVRVGDATVNDGRHTKDMGRARGEGVLETAPRRDGEAEGCGLHEDRPTERVVEGDVEARRLASDRVNRRVAAV